ncbi:hypothetical protein RchiOBHm_Chr2g0132061 [Rosa chinensis]|uniref:Uncharacterized protein n=1 Tax=Rosa chinensis TaxID=74649 RepID=A0A2P6RV89_ROSCH|nr:hypothetical protein RchiOBHm_Chr2g0132061 [Rosa chinensis]
MGDYCTLTGSPRTQHQQLPSRRPVCTTFGHHSHVSIVMKLHIARLLYILLISVFNGLLKFLFPFGL